MIRFLLHLLGLRCAHAHRYLERRKLHGVEIMHLVCERCGDATPAIDRTAADHRRVVRIGRPRLRRARVRGQGDGEVVSITNRRHRGSS